MGQERPRKVKHPLYKGTSDDRSNLEIKHSRCVAWAAAHSHRGMSMILLWAALIPLLLMFGYFNLIEGHFIFLMIFVATLICFLSSLKFFDLSREYSIQVKFIEIELGISDTFNKCKIEFEQFVEEKEKTPSIRRRIYRFLHKKLKYY